MKKENEANPSADEKRKRLVEQLKKNGALHSPRIENAFLSIPRETFVLSEWKRHAYADDALPFAPNQTISQPSTIAMMLEFLELKRGQKVLEVGSGCGYVLALLSRIVGKKGNVLGIEVMENSTRQSRQKMDELNLSNVEITQGNGREGWPKKSPFERILVSAACREIPPKLVNQLTKNGKLVAPVGSQFSQQLVKLEKKRGILTETSYMGGYFVFVPLHD